MSMVIEIDNLPNFSSIFEEIERRNRENRPRAFTTMELSSAENYSHERKPRSCTVIQREPTKCKPNLGRRASDPTGTRLSAAPSRIRIQSAPACPSIDRAILKDEPRLTEAAKKLSNEELALLYEDILKPLDFYSILFTRLNLATNKQHCPEPGYF